MGNVIFLDVDTQHDFMVPDGRLYVPHAEQIAPNLKHLTEFARTHDIVILATADDHAMDDAEFAEEPDYRETFPPHCLRNTPGQRKIPATAMENPVVIENEAAEPARVREKVEEHDGEILVKKSTLDMFRQPNFAAVLDVLAPDHVVLYGVALDVCDRLAVEGLLRRGGATVHVVTDAVRAVRPEEGTRLLEEWEHRGVRLTTTAAIVENGYLDGLS